MTNLSHAVREAAGSVIDPELRRSLAELGMIGAVSAENGVAQVEVRLTIAGCPAAQKIESDVRAAAASVSGVTEVAVDVQVMTAEQRAELLAHLRPGGPKQNPFGPGTLTRVIAVTSGKGGVGKSTLTANLAASLAHQGFRVGILDADVYGFSIPALMGLAPDGVAAKPTRLDDMIVPPVGHDVKVISIGMFVENANAAVAWRGPMLQRTITQFLTDVYFGDLDFLLLDLPPGTGDVAITVGQQLPNAEVLVVTTGQSAASEVAVRAGVVARQTGQRILGVVENMGPLVLQDGSAIALFGQGGADAVAHELSIGQDKAIEVLARIPLSLGLREGGDQGTPIVLSHPADPAALAINELARVIAHSGPSRAGINLGISPV
ncbi:Mrp/NBP35 family ATP-binding protein [Aurantimicrobium minutum]|uniref:Iron-sulfur cluster carrier protein n=1 Tax=Aurantimicrobium minutum TaxID=708131 RepID=A0A173LWR5_9MICO|nr:Mrp/NBP35 family ATP-binding protein [Aurantimicrobium minutum]BAU99415.1 chromosome partitioning protein [Aurantimicrobium minutum]